MNQPTLPPDIRQLSVAERILLAQMLWDRVVADQERLEVTRAQREALRSACGGLSFFTG